MTPASPATSPAPSVVKEVRIEDEAGYSPAIEYARQKVLAAPAVRRLAHKKWFETLTQPIKKIFLEVDYNTKPHYLSPYAWLFSEIFFS